MDPKTPRTPRKDGGKPHADAAAKSPAKKQKKKKDGKTPRNKDRKGKNQRDDPVLTVSCPSAR
eukprot:6236460-Amphidinium_carterae.1